MRRPNPGIRKLDATRLGKVPKIIILNNAPEFLTRFDGSFWAFPVTDRHGALLAPGGGRVGGRPLVHQGTDC
jgi:hypothetical protein